MATLNLCQFIGNVGQDPEVRATASGEAVANLSLACNEKWKGKDGTPQESTEWVRAVAFGKRAELIQQYVTKGSQLYISGKMRTRKYQANDGSDRYSTEIIIDSMQFIGSKRDGGQQQQQPQQQPQQQQGGFVDFDDDIPF